MSKHFVLLGIVFALAMSALAEMPRVDVFVPTDRLNPHLDDKGRPDRHDALHLEFASVELDDIPEIIAQTQAVLPEFDADHPPIVPFYLAKHRSEEERASLVAEAQEKLDRAFPGLHPQIRVHLIDDKEDDVHGAAAAFDQKLADAAALMPQDEATADGLARTREASRLALQETEAAIAQSRAGAETGTSNRGTFVDKLFRRAAAVRSVLAFGSRGVQAATTASASTGSVLAGVALVGFDSAWEYFWSRYELQIAKVFLGSPLAVDGGRHPFLERLAAFYPTVRATVLSTLTAGIARPVAANLLAHLTSPSAVPLFGGAKYAMLGGISVAYGTFYYGGLKGVETLRQKGWLSGPWAEFALRAPGFVGMAAGLALSAPVPCLRALAPVIFGGIWSVWAAAFVAAKLLPTRTDKLVLVDSALGHYRAQINSREALEYTEVASLRPEEMQEALRKVQAAVKLNSDAGPRRLSLGQRVSALIRHGCGALFGALRPSR